MKEEISNLILANTSSPEGTYSRRGGTTEGGKKQKSNVVVGDHPNNVLWTIKMNQTIL